MKKVCLFFLFLVLTNAGVAQVVQTLYPETHELEYNQYDGPSYVDRGDLTKIGKLGGNDHQYMGYVVFTIPDNYKFVSGTVKIRWQQIDPLGTWIKMGLSSNFLSKSTTEKIQEMILRNNAQVFSSYDLDVSYSSAPNGKILFGLIKPVGVTGYNYISSITLDATLDPLYSVNVANNFQGGKIRAKVDLPSGVDQTAPVVVKDISGKTVYISGVDNNNYDNSSGYYNVFNDTEAPLNTSVWIKRNVQLSQVPGYSVASQSTTFTIVEAENNYTYEAQMKKLCNVTLISSSGSVTANGSNYFSPAVVPIVEQNTITASSSNYSSNYVYYTFQNWKKDGSTYSSPITITAHGSYNAVYKAKPENSVMSVHFNCDIGDPVRIDWTDHPDAHVNQYEIRRTVKHNGVTGPVEVIGTVGRGVCTFTDETYMVTSTYVDLLNYDVRAYYVSDNNYIIGDYSTANFLSLYGEISFKINANNTEQFHSLKEIPSEYSISNYPNPFNPTTTISYQLPENGFVTIKVYDVLGKEAAVLVNEYKQAGYYSVNFDAGKLTSGIYISTIQAGNVAQSKKMLLIK